MRARLLSLLLLWVACWSAGAAWGQAPAEPPPQPMLRIDAGLHGQIINYLATDAAGRIVATASDDKTLRLWSIADGALLATLRPPIGPDDEGALYAVALSPDGASALVGGVTGVAWDRSFAVYLFDVGQGKLKGRLAGLPGPVYGLTYAPDGGRFAIALGGKAGLRVHDAANGKLLFGDAAYDDRLVAFAFHPQDGRLAAAGYDGRLRFYAPDGKKTEIKLPGGKPHSLAFSPDGARLAIGYVDQNRVDLLDAKSGKILAQPSAGGSLAAVAWTSDGRLLAGGGVTTNDGWRGVRVWPAGLGSATQEWKVARDTLTDVRPTPDGGALVASAEPSLSRYDAQGRLVWRKGAAGLDFRDMAERHFSVSEDGAAVAFQPKGATTPWRFDLTRRSLGDAAGAAQIPGAARTLPATAPAGVENWLNRPNPKIAGRAIRMEPEELARSLAATPDKKIIVLGTDSRLITANAQGQSLGEARLPAPAWAVTVAADGRTVIAALGDGSLRWWSLTADGGLAPRAALFAAADGQRWALWTPEGFFDHSDRGGEHLVGFQLNRGRSQQPDWLSLAQLYRLFNAPDLVQRRTLDAPGAAAEAQRRLAEMGDLRERLTRKAPPKIDQMEVCWTAQGRESCQTTALQATTRSLTPVAASAIRVDVALPPDAAAPVLRVSLSDQGGGFGASDVFINGRNAGRLEPGATPQRRAHSLNLTSGQNQLTVRAYDAAESTYGESRILTVSFTPPEERALTLGPSVGAAPGSPDTTSRIDARPRLFALIAGVNAYRGDINPLRFAVPDARAFAQALKAGAGDLWRATDIVELYDAQASRAAVQEALARFAREAEPQDAALIYLSGHGFADEATHVYYFVTQDAPSVAKATETSFSDRMLIQALSNIKARNGMVFLDTCYAGAAALDPPGQLAHESGRYLLAGSSSEQEALDSYDNRNGVFATALLRGLNGGAARSDASQVTNFELGFYVRPLVLKLAQEKRHNQKAVFQISASDAEPFPIVSLKKP